VTSLRETSAYDGLDRRVVTQADLVAHSIAVICPSASALSTAFMLPRVVGPGAWVSVLLGIALSYVLAAAFSEFGSRFVAPGSLYTYAAKGLGPAVALVVGCSMLLGYGALVSYGLTDASRQATRAVEATTGSETSAVTPVLVVLAGAALCIVVMRQGIRHSARVAFATEAVTLTFLVVVLGVVAGRNGLPGLGSLSPGGSSLHDILVGTAMVMTVTIGFESSAALGVEAIRPFRSVPRAMRLSVLITGVLLMAGVVINSESTERTRGRWFHPGAVVSYADAAVLLVIAASYIALALCAWTALTRLLFAFGRDGLLPAALGRTRRRTGNPSVAVGVTAPIVLLPMVFSLLHGEPPGWASYELLIYATLILFVAYALTAAAVLPFLARLGELTGRVVALAVGGTVGITVVGVVEVQHDIAADQPDVVLALVLLLIVALLWRIGLALRPSGVVNLGRHEETLRRDVLIPGDPGEGDG
jgi:amino acid transporter